MGRYALTDVGFIIDRENLYQSDMTTSSIIGDTLIERYKISNGQVIEFTYKIIKESDNKEDLHG